jgi:predicted NodU family carbamoyl transferase
MTGGGGLNVITNQQLRTRYPLVEVNVPPSPSDGGLSIGAAWSIDPPADNDNFL